MGVSIIDYPQKEPDEKVPYTIDLARYSSFRGANKESVNSIVSVTVYAYPGTPGSPTPIAAMVGPTAYGADWITCWIGGGVSTPDTEGIYIFRVRFTTDKGSAYTEQGKFTVKEV